MLEENFNNQFSLEKTGLTILEYPSTQLNSNENEPNKKFNNILDEYTESNPKISFREDLNTQSFSIISQSSNESKPIVNNFSVIENPKTGVTFCSGKKYAIMEEASNSTNDFNSNYNKSNNFDNFGIEISNSEDTFNDKNKENFYLSNADIVNNSMNMNNNTNQNINDNFDSNNIVNEETKKDEKKTFGYNDMLINELIDTKELNNHFSTNEAGFNISEYTTKKNDEKSNLQFSTNQTQLSLKEKKLNNIQTTSTTNDIYNDYFQNDFNYNSELIHDTFPSQNDLTNILLPSYTNASIAFNQQIQNEIKQEKIYETRDSSTQTENSDLVLNISLKISPFETKLQNINISSNNQNSEKGNKVGEKTCNLTSIESIDISSKPDSKNQKTPLKEFIDAYNLEMFSPSPFAKISKMKHLEQNSENRHKNETIPKSELESNLNNIPIEIQDNNIFVEQNVKNEDKPLSKKENKGNSLRYSILESNNNKEIDLANIYAIAEAEILEDNKKSSKDFSNY